MIDVGILSKIVSLFHKIFNNKKNNRHDEINKFDDKTRDTKIIQLQRKSDELLKQIERTENQINSLVESAKGKTQSEKKRIASRIKTLQYKKLALESECVSVEKELRTGNTIESHLIGDDIAEKGFTTKLDSDKMKDTLMKRRIDAQERDEKVTTINRDLSNAISSTNLDEDSNDVLNMLNKLDEDSLEPEDVKKQVDMSVE